MVKQIDSKKKEEVCKDCGGTGIIFIKFTGTKPCIKCLKEKDNENNTR